MEKMSEDCAITPQIARLLAVGPIPPPLTGTGISFQMFCDEVRQYTNQFALETINASPRQIKEDPRLLTWANLDKARAILGPFSRRIKAADRVLIYGSHQFLFTMGALCLFRAKLAGKPCYFRSFGDLDWYYDSLSPAAQRFYCYTVQQLDGLFVETRLVYTYLSRIVGDKVHWVPGYRPMPAVTVFPGIRQKPDRKLNLVFLSLIREEKGIFVLLESLRAQRIRDNEALHCDIYGPIYPSVAERFANELRGTPNATYKGVVQPEETVQTLSQYDIFVFPTFYPGEGHPGVLMEAMMAGVPVIASAHRSIPELVENEVNGLLTQPRDVQSLVEAICRLDADRQLLTAMAQRNWERRTRHATSEIVPVILKLMGLTPEQAMIGKRS